MTRTLIRYTIAFILYFLCALSLWGIYELKKGDITIRDLWWALPVAGFWALFSEYCFGMPEPPVTVFPYKPTPPSLRPLPQPDLPPPPAPAPPTPSEPPPTTPNV